MFHIPFIPIPNSFTDPSGSLMMLPTDLALIQDPKFKPIVEEYAKDKAVFFKDFAAAFGKLMELGWQGPKNEAKL